MRIFGYILLAVGFASTLWYPMRLRDIERAAVIHSLPPDGGKQLYSRGELTFASSRSAAQMGNHWDVFFYSGVSMFVGGIFIDFAKRRRRVADYAV